MNRDRHYNDPANSDDRPESTFFELDARARFEQLSAYLDDELTDAERAQVQQWMDLDPRARAQYRQFVQLRSGFSRLSVPDVARNNGDATAERVLERLQKPWWRPPSPTRWGKVYRRYAPIAAGAIAAFTGWVAWEAFHPPQPLVSLDTPPVVIPTLVANSPAMRQAGTYLLGPTSDRDAYTILFDDAEGDSASDALWQ
ncbi:MAG: hypothetical protein AAF704_01810 [Cyanobacteria bacterium P01_D01_bin.123]